MRVLVRLVPALLASLAAPALAQPVDTFVEGHVFNRRTGVPIAGAIVRVPDACIPCAGPSIPRELTTDDNGFYSAGFFGGSSTSIVPIEVVCLTRLGEITGNSQADLRPGTVRRDVYLRGPESFSRCLPPPE